MSIYYSHTGLSVDIELLFFKIIWIYNSLRETLYEFKMISTERQAVRDKLFMKGLISQV